jgi:hypothetical protein
MKIPARLTNSPFAIRYSPLLSTAYKKCPILDGLVRGQYGPRALAAAGL